MAKFSLTLVELKYMPMLWRTFSGEPLRLPVKRAVEEAIVRETKAGFHLKV